MTKRQQKQIISFILVLVVMILPMLAMAQSDGGTPDGGGELDTPIDGGLSLLVAAGVGYGAKKMKERKEKSVDLK